MSQTDINRVVITGNVVFDPELRFTAAKQIPVVNLKLAVHEKRRDSEEVETSFIGVAVFGDNARMAKRKYRKGSWLMVDGRITTERYTDFLSGEKIDRVAIIALHIRHIDAPRESAETEGVAA